MDGAKGTRHVRGYIGLSLVWLAIMGAALLITRRPTGQPIEILPPPNPATTTAPAQAATPAPVRVDVAGAVRSPGVYALPPDSLVADAIAAAGGPADDADLERVNKAAPLQDGKQVFIPRAGQPTPIPPPAAASVTRVPAAAGQTTTGTKKVNLNTATLEELDTLPGVGPATAQKIVEGRPYGSIEDLVRVKGIGEATLEKLKDLITVR